MWNEYRDKAMDALGKYERVQRLIDRVEDLYSLKHDRNSVAVNIDLKNGGLVEVDDRTVRYADLVADRERYMRVAQLYATIALLNNPL